MIDLQLVNCKLLCSILSFPRAEIGCFQTSDSNFYLLYIQSISNQGRLIIGLLFLMIVPLLYLSKLEQFIFQPGHWLNEYSVCHLSGRPGFNSRSSHTKGSKMVLDAVLLSTHHYRVRIKGKVEQSREWISAPQNTMV